jgi:hypothetical protein
MTNSAIIKYGVEATFNDITSLMNLIQICTLVQKLLVVDTQRYRQTAL